MHWRVRMMDADSAHGAHETCSNTVSRRTRVPRPATCDPRPLPTPDHRCRDHHIVPGLDDAPEDGVVPRVHLLHPEVVAVEAEIADGHEAAPVVRAAGAVGREAAAADGEVGGAEDELLPGSRLVPHHDAGGDEGIAAGGGDPPLAEGDGEADAA